MIISFDGEELEIDILHFSGGTSAQLNGPPEDCYPEEYPEIEYAILTKGFEHWEGDPILDQLVYAAYIEEYSCDPEPDDYDNHYYPENY